MHKQAGPTLKEKAWANVPGAADKLREEQKARAHREAHPNPLGSLNEQKRWLRQQGSRNLARLTPEQRADFWNDAFAVQHIINTARVGGAGLATLPFTAGWPFIASAITALGPPVATGFVPLATGKGPGKEYKASVLYSQPEFRKMEIPENVKYFYDNIVPAIKARGNDGTSYGQTYNESLYVPGFYDRVPVYSVKREHSAFPDSHAIVGYQDGSYRSSLNKSGVPGRVVAIDWEKDNAPTIVHELKHAQNRDGARMYRWYSPWKFYDEPSGRSGKDDMLLDDAYAFEKSDVGGMNLRQEQATTHAEHQFAIMNELAGKLGRMPTADEFVKYVTDADRDTLARWRRYKPNGYQESADKRLEMPGEIPESDLQSLPESFSYASPDSIRNTDWYRKSPDLFDPLLKRLGPDSKGTMYPREIYRSGIMRRGKGFSDDKLDAFRKALLEVARNNGGRNDATYGSYDAYGQGTKLASYVEGFMSKLAEAGMALDDIEGAGNRLTIDFSGLSGDRRRRRRRHEIYVEGSGTVESFRKDRSAGHDEIVIRLNDGRRLRISNNTRLGKRTEPEVGDTVNYHGYGIDGTDVVHRVHPNAHSRGGWLESLP